MDIFCPKQPSSTMCMCWPHGPYTIKAKVGAKLVSLCLTMVDPFTGWFEIIELPNDDITNMSKGKEIIKMIIDKSFATISYLFNNSWLSCYPRTTFVIYDTVSELNLHFETMCNSYGLVHEPTLIKNAQANGILEQYTILFQTWHAPPILTCKTQQQQRICWLYYKCCMGHL